MGMRKDRQRSDWRREPALLAVAGVLLVAPVAISGLGVATAFSTRQRPAVRPAVISGDVRQRSENGDAAPSVEVWAADAATGREVSRDQTEGDGHFTLTVPPGRYSVLAGRTGYLQSTYGSVHYGFPGSPLVVSGGQRVEVRIVIQRAPAVLGVVRDDLGRPISNATVDILQPSISDGPERQVVSRTTTDTSGVYRVDGLVPGEYLAVAIAPRPTAAATGPVQLQTPAAQFFPASDAESSAVRLALKANEERGGVDFTLPRRTLTRLAGIVSPTQGVRLLDDILVIVTGVGDSPPTWDAPPILDARVGFSLLLHRGRYRVDIRALGSRTDQPERREARLYAASAVVEVGEVGSIKREFPIGEALGVSGRVREPDGRTTGLRVRLVPASARQPAARPIEATIAGDGRFDVEGILPGRYSCELIDADATRALDIVRFRGRAQPSPMIDIEDTVGVAEFDLIVAPTTASLSGMVHSARAAPASYMIGLVAEGTAADGRDSSRHYLTRADNTGAYSLSKLLAGSYLLYLLRDPDPAFLEKTIADSSRNNAAGGIRVTLATGVETRLDLRVADLELRGRPR